jgi:hypothetical protein
MTLSLDGGVNITHSFSTLDYDLSFTSFETTEFSETSPSPSEMINGLVIQSPPHLTS